MRRLWWPEPLYEMKPFGALALGLLAALLGSARSWATHNLDATLAVALTLAAALIVYATAILRMRQRYRRRSRWNRQRWY